MEKRSLFFWFNCFRFTEGFALFHGNHDFIMSFKTTEDCFIHYMSNMRYVNVLVALKKQCKFNSGIIMCSFIVLAFVPSFIIHNADLFLAGRTS